MVAAIFGYRGVGHATPGTAVTMATSPASGMKLKEITLTNAYTSSNMTVAVRINTFTYIRLVLGPGESSGPIRCDAYVASSTVIDVIDDVGSNYLHWHISYITDPNAAAPPTLTGARGYYDGPSTFYDIWTPTISQDHRVQEVAVFNASTTTSYFVRIGASSYYWVQFTLGPLESALFNDIHWYLNSNMPLTLWSDAPDGTLMYHYTGLLNVNG